jgi:hypothetical protein
MVVVGHHRPSLQVPSPAVCLLEQGLGEIVALFRGIKLLSLATSCGSDDIGVVRKKQMGRRVGPFLI